MVGFVAASNLKHDEDLAPWSRCYFGTASISLTGCDSGPWQTRLHTGAGAAESTLHPAAGHRCRRQAATTVLRTGRNLVGICPDPRWAVISHGPLIFMVGKGSISSRAQRLFFFSAE